MRKVIDKTMEFLTAALMAVMVVVALWQVFTRFVLNDPSTISEEFLRYSLIWLTLVGAALAHGKKKHLAVLFAVRKFPKKRQPIVGIIIEIFVILFAVIILIIGGSNATQSAVGQISSAMQLPMQYLYLCLPIGGVLFSYYAIMHIIGYLKELKNSKTEKTEV